MYKLGEEIKLLQIEVDKYRPYYYAGASRDFNTIHIDNEFGKSVGLGGIILQGLCTMAYVYRAVVGNKDPEKIKSLRVRFRGIVRPLDKINIKGKVSKFENNLATIEMIAENQKNEQVITNASAVIEE
jgi:acyl dehydratase